MITKEKLQEIEEHVSVIKDLELRKIAFEKLIGAELGGGVEDKKIKGVIQKNKVKSKSSKTNKKVLTVNSVQDVIKLSEQEMIKLKNFFKGQEYNNGNELIFKLCNFLRIELKRGNFSSEDIKQIYDHLISLRIKVLPLKHIHQTMVNLCGKSNKKMWLENKGNKVFAVSSVGKIQWMDIEDETKN